MKAKIIITPKKVVVDPQGRAVQTALEHIGYKGIGAVHVGRYLEIDITAVDKETAGKQIDDACRKILSNPIVEDYRFDID
jgi:phosphoribosylformylglycinamidine synthase